MSWRDGEKVPHRCVKCGRERFISRGARRLIERGLRKGQCTKCNRVKVPSDGPSPRSPRPMTSREIEAWAHETLVQMSDRDRQALHEIAPLDDRRIAA